MANRDPDLTAILLFDENRDVRLAIAVEIAAKISGLQVRREFILPIKAGCFEKPCRAFLGGQWWILSGAIYAYTGE
jgi:hypothetical protein